MGWPRHGSVAVDVLHEKYLGGGYFGTSSNARGAIAELGVDVSAGVDSDGVVGAIV